MIVGKLDTRCRIEKKTVTTDPEYGTEVIIWTPLAVVWCNVKDTPPSRSEAVKNGLTVARNQSRVRMHYRTDVDSSMRFVISRPSAFIYQIVGGPAELGNHEFVEFVVERFSS